MPLTDESFSKSKKSVPYPIPVPAAPDSDEKPYGEPEEALTESDLPAMADITDLTDPEDEDDEDLLSSVFDGDNTDEINQAALMTVAVDYAFKRGKIKKSIRKVCHKLIKKYSLEPVANGSVRNFTENCCKRFVRTVCSEYRGDPSQAVEIAYFGAVWLVFAYKNDVKGIAKDEKDAWKCLTKHVQPEELRGKMLKQLQDKKGKSLRILIEYTEKLRIADIWENIDGRMKKKLLKGAYWLGALRAMKN